MRISKLASVAVLGIAAVLMLYVFNFYPDWSGFRRYMTVAGILVGSYWGLFFGGLGGMVVKVVALSHGGPRRTIPAESREALLIAEAGGQTDTLHAVMRRHGASCFLEGVASHQPVHEPLALAS